MDDKTSEQIADELLAKAGVDTRRTNQNNSKGQQKRKAADVLIDLSAGAEELFHAPDGTGYATIPVDDHLETWPIRSKGFKRWLARAFFAETSSAPNSDAIQSALNVIEARAHFDGVERDVYIRVGSHEGRIYLDLADKRWRVVKIDATGWRIVDHAPIPFRRSAGMRALPDPVHGGSINELRPSLNIRDGEEGEKDFVLTVSFVLAALRDCGPYPGLGLTGAHGAAKSTFTKVLRKLIDPNSAPTRALPREDRDLFIAANNAHLLAFDNISRLPDWISDTLCRLATGGGFATRSLYTDTDETLFDAMRPVILNGIENTVIRPDLADRHIFLSLEEIPEEDCKAEREFWENFERVRPRILGVLLDGVACGLRELPKTRLAKTPRMADFALWATACETAFWEAGTFMRAYSQNRAHAVTTVIEADLVATAVQDFMAERPDLAEQPSLIDQLDPDVWQGTSTVLYKALTKMVGQEKAKLKEWPKAPNALSGKLRRHAPSLRKVGIEISFDDRDSSRKRTRAITIARMGGGIDRPDRPNRPTSQDVNDLASDGRPDGDGATVRASDGMPDGSDATVRPTVRSNPLKNKASDGADDSDANFPTQTGKGAEVICVHCGRPGGNEVAFGDEIGPVWLHRECEAPWIERRMGEEGILRT